MYISRTWTDVPGNVNYTELYRTSGVFLFFFPITNNAIMLRLRVQDHIKVSAHIMTPASVAFSLQVILKIATRVQ